MTWPVPALLAWGLAWAVFAGLGALQIWSSAAFVAASAVGALLSALGTTRWRRIFIAAGFPLSLLASGTAGNIPAWAWLLPLALLALLYPVSTWQDAPLFPTPEGALRGLATLAPLPSEAAIVDAGCGMGDGLRQLHREYPSARIVGLEWSWPLRFVCAWRCRFADVRRADVWKEDWAPFDLVYLFQRPESMPRAHDKAVRELRAGAWLVSLEFEVPALQPRHVLQSPDGRPVWVYQAPLTTRSLV